MVSLKTSTSTVDPVHISAIFPAGRSHAEVQVPNKGHSRQQQTLSHPPTFMVLWIWPPEKRSDESARKGQEGGEGITPDHAVRGQIPGGCTTAVADKRTKVAVAMSHSRTTQELYYSPMTPRCGCV